MENCFTKCRDDLGLHEHQQNVDGFLYALFTVAAEAVGAEPVGENPCIGVVSHLTEMQIGEPTLSLVRTRLNTLSTKYSR